MAENSKLIDVNGLSVFLEGVRQETSESIAEAGLGVTYTLTKNKDGEIVLTGSDGSSTKVSDDNTTYGFSQSGTTLTITPSDGSEPVTVTLGEDITSEKIISALGYIPTSQSYVDNKLIISSTQPVSQDYGEWLEVLS